MDQTKENKHDDYSPTVDYLAYSRLRDVNVIPEADYKARQYHNEGWLQYIRRS